MSNPWDAVFDQVRVLHPPEGVTVPKPTAVELDGVESELKTRLPASYRAFLERFGPGELMNWVQLNPPTPVEYVPYTVASHTDEFKEAAKICRWTEFTSGAYSDFVFFASSGGGDAYAWNPREAQLDRLYECRFYMLRHGREQEPQLVADSFFEFVSWVETYVRSWNDSISVDEPGILFGPYRVRQKQEPPRRDAKAWLAANGHTARDLVRAIQLGRTDAFPVLADALEEAGCTNRDVLDSCRTGDPDIDGAWVLRVLFGDDAKAP